MNPRLINRKVMWLNLMLSAPMRKAVKTPRMEEMMHIWHVVFIATPKDSPISMRSRLARTHGIHVENT
jgi:hypothetical protein